MHVPHAQSTNVENERFSPGRSLRLQERMTFPGRLTGAACRGKRRESTGALRKPESGQRHRCWNGGQVLQCMVENKGITEAGWEVRKGQTVELWM